MLLYVRFLLYYMFSDFPYINGKVTTGQPSYVASMYHSAKKLARHLDECVLAT